jgi:hypothetical protein
VARQNIGVPLPDTSLASRKNLLSKISKSGQGQLSVYSVGETIYCMYREPAVHGVLQYVTRWSRSGSRVVASSTQTSVHFRT